MSTIFPTAFASWVFANPTTLNGANLGMVLLREAPNFEDQDSRYIGITNRATLFSMPGFLEAAGTGLPLTATQSVSIRTIGVNHYILLNNFPLTGISPTEVKAIAFYYVGTISGVTNPIIMITNNPFSTGRTVLTASDGITAQPDSSMTGSNRWIFAWADPPVGATTVQLVDGPVAINKGVPPFESSHAQHVWLYPQRANLAANPSFELTGMGFWSTNGTATRVAGGAPGGGAWSGQFTVGSGTVIAESNVFPTFNEEVWTIQLMAKGNGRCKVGLVHWDDTFIETRVDWGPDEWLLNTTSFTHIKTIRTAPDGYQGMVRIECLGGPLTIDNVCVEAGSLVDWPYFDGSTTYGARGDFAWYGGAGRQGASYSLWYNNKNAIFGRMFALDYTGAQVITDEVVAAQGFVYQWVPAGTVVIPHMDALYVNDLQAPVPTKAAGVLAYRSNVITDVDKVLSPW